MTIYPVFFSLFFLLFFMHILNSLRFLDSRSERCYEHSSFVWFVFGCISRLSFVTFHPAVDILLLLVHINMKKTYTTPYSHLFHFTHSRFSNKNLDFYVCNLYSSVLFLVVFRIPACMNFFRIMLSFCVFDHFFHVCIRFLLIFFSPTSSYLRIKVALIEVMLIHNANGNQRRANIGRLLRSQQNTKIISLARIYHYWIVCRSRATLVIHKK